MDLERLDWIYPFDVEVLACNFMRLHLESYDKGDLWPEDLVTFATDQMGKFDWQDPEHHLYSWLLNQAEILVEEYVEEESNVRETYEEPDRDW